MRFSMVLIVSLCFIVSCKNWEYPQSFPIVLTLGVNNISSEGAEFVGSVESLGVNQNVVDYGFVWSESPMPTLNSSHVIMAEAISRGKFVKTVNSDLTAGGLYFVKAFIRTDKLLIYGNQITFTSQGSRAPMIIDFSPKRGFDGTEITIEGRNFSAGVKGNSVRMGGLACSVISATDSVLRIKSPVTSVVGDVKISVSVAGQIAVSKNEYAILGPRIHSISKLSGRVGDLLIMEGEFFDIANYMWLLFGDEQFGFNESLPYVLSADKLECYVPDVPGTVGKVQLQSFSDTGERRFRFLSNFTIVNSLEKLSNSTPLVDYNDPVRFSSTTIGNSIFVMGGNSLYEFNTVALTWTKRKDFPGGYRFYGTSFAFNGKVYYGFGEGYHPAPACCNNGLYFGDLWQYDPATDAWSFLENSPLVPRGRVLQFVIGNTAYLGFGKLGSPTYRAFDDLWSYDLETATWSEVPVPISINSNSVAYATSFAVNGKGYMVGLKYSDASLNRKADLVEFDPAIPSWTTKSDYPDMIYGENATTINNHGLVVSSTINHFGNSVYEYDPIKDRWIRRQRNTQTTAPIQFSHFVNGDLYYAAGSVWKLNFD